MSASRRLHHVLAALLSSLLCVGASVASAQSLHTFKDSGVVPDDALTLVVGTRFVGPSEEGASARAQFTDSRIPLGAFNDTDHCVDQRALEVAQEYFEGLGRVMGKAGHYYFVPEAEIGKSVSLCEKQHGRPPQAWVDTKTKIIAFGRVVPTEDAPALERSVR